MKLNNMARIVSAGLISFGVLGGCASPKVANVQVDPAVVKLSEAANEISSSYRVLSYAESARLSSDGAAVPKKYEIEDFPEQWQKRYALEDDFYGELEPFIRGLAKLAGYNEPQILGPRPVIPIPVSVNRSQKPLAEFLLDASYQAGSRANVILSGTKGITIVYPQ